jgi:D-alanyl-lipoteichoic acid acyltransferase DltB (MBOAT superfamily)
MLFNSIDFAFFLPIVLIFFWLLKNTLKVQNTLLLGASYVFYGWWDWRFLSLIAISSVLDYAIGLKMHKTEKNRKYWLALSLSVNLGMLAFFKYADFFAQSFADAFTFFGQDISVNRLNIILPVGISFYTFQTLSYTLDIYKRKLEPTKSLVSFLAFVSFFPQLVAGPIERASHLLPQFFKTKKPDYKLFVNGLQQMLWGFFKKMVIADNCAIIVDQIFNQASDHNGATLLLGAIFFAFQIYGDFSGYSDIAIGTAKLFGFHLSQNFAFPYFSRDIAEFWRKWHISLSSWFKDYLYIPLGGSRGTIKKTIRNILIIFLVSGFWHGANWTFVFWGLAHALLFIPLFTLNRNRTFTENNNSLSPINLWRMLSTFILVSLAWVLFRAQNIEQAFVIYSKIFDFTTWATPEVNDIKMSISLILFLLIIEWNNRTEINPLKKVQKLPSIVRWMFYGFILFLISMFSPTKELPFIYFQF